MKKYFKGVLSFLIICMVMQGVILVSDNNVVNASGGLSIKNIPAKTLTIKKGNTRKLTVSKSKFTVKTSNKKIATVKKSGKSIRITAKKTGKSNITIKSGKKKLVIKVTVGTPVKKVKLNKSKVNITVGKKITLKASVSNKKASNKKLIWKSSNNKVATVSNKGVVTAKNKGKIKITVTAADGSGKKAVCTVVVENKKVQAPSETPSQKDKNEESIFKQVKMINNKIMMITLSEKVNLTNENLHLWLKRFKSGNYLYEKKVDEDDIFTEDGIVYYVFIPNVNPEGATHQLFKVCIDGYKDGWELEYTTDLKEEGNGKTYEGKYIYETFKRGEAQINTVHISDYLGLGYLSVSWSGTPDGIDMYLDYRAQMQYLVLAGTPTKCGRYEIELNVVDERGYSSKNYLIVTVYDEDTIFCEDVKQKCYITGFRARTQTALKLYGGSGEYKIECLDELGEVIYYRQGTHNLVTIFGQDTKPGKYLRKVKIMDKNNENVSTIINLECEVISTERVLVSMYDADGLLITYERDSLLAYVYDMDGNTVECYGDYNTEHPLEGGVYEIYLEEGSYYIHFRLNNIETVCRVDVNKGDNYTDVKFNVRKINIISNDERIDFNYIHNYWRYQNDRVLGIGSTVYVKGTKGTISQKGSVGEDEYTATVTYDLSSGKNEYVADIKWNDV